MELIIAKKKRQLTKFLCREMIYDYVKGHLDEDRRQAVQNFLSKDEDLRDEVERLQSAIDFCQELGRVDLSHDFYEEVSGHESQLNYWFKILSWGHLPDRAKWVLEAIAIAALVAGFSILIPWQNIFKSIPQDKPPILVDSETQFEIATNDSMPSGLEDSENITDPQNTGTVTGGLVEAKDPLQSESLIENSQTASEPVESTHLAEDTSETSIDTQGEAEDFENNDISEEVEESVEPTKKKPILVGKKEALKGVLFRAFLKLDDIEKHTEEFREKILSLGGEKAGEVQIGWRKPDGSYFHFSMDEENLEILKQYMSGYGPVRFYKDPHWRVMPEGKIRMILWVEDSEYKK